MSDFSREVAELLVDRFKQETVREALEAAAQMLESWATCCGEERRIFTAPTEADSPCAHCILLKSSAERIRDLAKESPRDGRD